MTFVDWNGPYDDLEPRYGDENTAWRRARPVDGHADVVGLPREDVEHDPHAGDLIDTSAESAPTAEDGPQPWEQT